MSLDVAESLCIMPGRLNLVVQVPRQATASYMTASVCGTCSWPSGRPLAWTLGIPSGMLVVSWGYTTAELQCYSHLFAC